ncbi:hypothetical protein P8C59_005278 [Phyllachora maydis]|uniref:Uncharacterized protein n=1 Tax=Phyllachora maydis TaxID=1825666 RepID=A0AAD9I4C8_9PEZI|nr:hypothetical protein P8C59_005278 [Phyllachora maydis]
MPLAPASIPAKPAKITPAACKLAKKEDLRRSKRTTSGNAGRYTTDSGLIANKDDNNAYDGAYVPPANTEEEEEGNSGDNNSVNGGTSDSADKGKGSGAYKRGKSALHCEDILLPRPIIARYLKVLMAFKPASAIRVISKGPINEDKELSYSEIQRAINQAFFHVIYLLLDLGVKVLIVL